MVARIRGHRDNRKDDFRHVPLYSSPGRHRRVYRSMIEIGGGLWWDLDTDVRTLYYRRDMLQDAGIDPAELDAENGPITVARITEIAASLRRGLHLFASWSSCQPGAFGYVSARQLFGFAPSRLDVVEGCKHWWIAASERGLRRVPQACRNDRVGGPPAAADRVTRSGPSPRTQDADTERQNPSGMLHLDCRELPFDALG